MKKGSKLKTLLRMLKLVKPLSGYMLLAIVMGTLGFLCAQFIPILGGFLVLHGLNIPVALPSSTLFIILIAIALLRAVLKYAEQRTNHYIAFTLLAIIRDKVFKALRRLCPAKLEGRDKGDLISLITGDVELLEVFYAHTVSPIAIAVLTELAMVLFIGSYHWALGLLAFAAYTSVGVILPLMVSKRSGNIGDELRADNGALSAFMLESIRGLDETIQYGNGKERMKALDEKTKALSKKQSAFNRLTGTNLAAANSMILVFDTAMLALSALLYLNGEVGISGLIIPLIALLSSFGPVSALAGLGTTLQATVASGARVLEVIDETPETEDVFGKKPVSFDGAKIGNLRFSYGGEDILKDVSLDIRKNRIIGIVGKSGCGKSTLLKLLMRFWKTDEGSIEISGRSIDSINTSDLRQMEGYMTQDTVLFKGTVEENIRVAKLDASREQIELACKKAALHDFITSLTNGYDTDVGELGKTLSGGERQRIGLARAFLHDAPFLLLDEPTSNLDSLNEAVILRSLKQESDGRTVLLVSHRASTVRIADERVFIENGRVS
ncbi:MAG: ABC transporter ATP-binding protein [Clostridia bacterium]|nr:ABC transporter ATP-binding protein [Clostridia bacterium]